MQLDNKGNKTLNDWLILWLELFVEINKSVRCASHVYVYVSFSCVQCARYSRINRSVGGNNNIESRALCIFFFFSFERSIVGPASQSAFKMNVRRNSRQIASHTEEPNEAATKKKKKKKKLRTFHCIGIHFTNCQVPIAEMSSYSRNVPKRSCYINFKTLELVPW